jgi:hypothetical protein
VFAVFSVVNKKKIRLVKKEFKTFEKNITERLRLFCNVETQRRDTMYCVSTYQFYFFAALAGISHFEMP